MLPKSGSPVKSTLDLVIFTKYAKPPLPQLVLKISLCCRFTYHHLPCRPKNIKIVTNVFHYSTSWVTGLLLFFRTLLPPGIWCMKMLPLKHGHLFHCSRSLVHPVTKPHTVADIPPTQLAKVMIELMMAGDHFLYRDALGHQLEVKEDRQGDKVRLLQVIVSNIPSLCSSFK